MEKINLKPLGDRILVAPVPEKSTTLSGLIIPESAKDKPREGLVVAVGPGKRTEAGQLVPIDVKPGDKILFGRYSGSDLKLDDVDYIVMHATDVQGIFEREEA